ncbi:MAG: hypothetical protein P8Z38_05495 [Robiginitalea sp.]
MKPSIPSVRIRYLFPLSGMALFILCYVIAAGLYPGGSWNDPGQVGFSWRHNYLCDLLDTRAVNGVMNAGRHWARAALGFLILGIAVLWYYLPDLTRGARRFKNLIRYAGLAALGITLFLSSETHDVTLRLAGVLGMTGVGSLLAGLWKNRLYGLVLVGLWCLGIFLVNYVIYETGRFLYALPLIQKITFSSFLAWFIWLDVRLWRQHGRIEEGISTGR